MILKFSLFISTLIFGTTTARNIPDFIHICQRGDKQVSQCVQNSVEELRPRLKNGIPEMNVPGLEPLRIKDIVIARGGDSTNFKAELQDVDVFGASGFQINKLHVDIPTHTITVGLTFPLLQLIGDYDVDAHVLVVPIKGHGKFYANATNCDARAVLKGNVVDVDGVRYLHFTSLQLDIDIADYSIRLENLFEGDQTLGKAANDVLNQNKKEFLLMAKPVIETKTSDILLETANKIVGQFPYDELFPEK